MSAAAEAFPEWSATPPGERRVLLLQAAESLEARADDFRDAVVAETGSPGHWSVLNLGLAAGMLREAAGLTTHVSGEVIPSDVPGSLAMSGASRREW